MPSQARTAEWAATAPWNGIQNVPANVAALATTQAFTGTIKTAALTLLGSKGSITFVNGFVTAVTPAT